MNERTTFRFFSALLLTAGLVLASSSARGNARGNAGGNARGNARGSARVLASQEKPKPAETKPTPSPTPTPTTTPAKADDPQAAQATGTPTSSPDQDQTWGPFTVYSSIEFGARGIGITGNGSKFRSDQNYEPGFRLFDGSLMMTSNGTPGALFDELMINTFGWSNDPNRYLRVDVTKTNLYKFSANYRRIAYFNNLTNFATPAGIPSSQHTFDSQYRQGDFDLTLWPAYEKFRLNLGYSLNLNSGSSTSTSRYSSDEFPVLAPVRMAAHDYRIGFDSKLWVFDLSFLQGWRFFKEDTTYFINQQQRGNSTTNTTVIDTYHRDAPIRGEMPYTRFSVHTLLGKRLDLTGRYVYAGGTTDHTYFDNLTGVNSSNRRVTSDAIRIVGDSKRPNSILDLSGTVLVTQWFRISDSFRFQQFSISGGNRFNQVAQVPTAAPPVTTTNRFEFENTKYRRYMNTIEADFDFRRFSFHVGHRFTDRHAEFSGQSFNVGSTPPTVVPEVFDNRSNAFIFGLKAKPYKWWSIYFDMEKGDTDNVFTRTANYDYSNYRVRSILRATNRLNFNASVTTRDNLNPTVINDRAYSANIDSRVFSGSADWTLNEKLNLSGGYTYFNVTSETIVQFSTSAGLRIGPAQYFMRDHFAFLTGYWEPHSRVSIYGAYRIHNDKGQGDLLSAPLLFISSYPYQLSSPEVKVSFKLHKNIDWILGYQYFDYKERFANDQYYQAHLPYTSLRIHFGRSE